MSQRVQGGTYGEEGRVIREGPQVRGREGFYVSWLQVQAYHNSLRSPSSHLVSLFLVCTFIAFDQSVSDFVSQNPHISVIENPPPSHLLVCGDLQKRHIHTHLP